MFPRTNKLTSSIYRLCDMKNFYRNIDGVHVPFGVQYGLRLHKLPIYRNRKVYEDRKNPTV